MNRFILTNSYPEKNKSFSSYEIEYLINNFDYKIISFAKSSKIKKKISDNIIYITKKKFFMSFFTIAFYKYIILLFKNIDMSFKNNFRQIYSYVIAITINRNISIKRNDLVYSYWFSRASMIGYYIKLINRNSFISQGHGSDILIYPPKNLKNILEVSDKVLTISEHNKEYIIKKYQVNPNKIKVCYLGVKQNKEKVIYQKRNIYISCGRFEVVKGFDLLIKNIAYARSQGMENFEVHIYGEGKEKQNLINLIEKLNLQRIIKLYPWIPNPNLSITLSKYKAYILSSRSEGLPVILMDSISVGLPIITNNVGSVNELVINSLNGYIYNSKEDFAKILDMFNLMTKDNYDILSQNALKIYKNKFDFYTNIEIKRKILEEVNDIS